MYYYGGGCSNNYVPYPMNYGSYGNNNYAIVLVLFILLVIVIGSRTGR